MTVQELAQARLQKAREIATVRWPEAIRSLIFDGQYDDTDGVSSAFAALSLANWQPPVDPDLLIAREAGAAYWDSNDRPQVAHQMRAGDCDDWAGPIVALAAIKLFKARQS